MGQHDEVARILRVAADAIESGATEGSLTDADGRVVGCFDLSESMGFRLTLGMGTPAFQDT